MKLQFLIILILKFTEGIMDSNAMNMQTSRIMVSILSKSITENPNCSLNNSTRITEQIEDVVSTNFNKSVNLQSQTLKNQVILNHNLTKISVENKDNFAKISVENQKLNSTEDLMHIRDSKNSEKVTHEENDGSTKIRLKITNAFKGAIYITIVVLAFIIVWNIIFHTCFPECCPCLTISLFCCSECCCEHCCWDL